MIKSRHSPADASELLQILREQTGPNDTVVIQAGHFLLYYDQTEAAILPGVSSELKSPRHVVVANEIGVYPFLTWRLGLSVLSSIAAARRFAMVVVNDWQYLPQEVDRLDFFRHNQRLPSVYRDEIKKYGSGIELLKYPPKPNLNTGDYFSEQTLRNAYSRHVKDLIRRNVLPVNVSVDKGEELSCSLADAMGNKREIYCSGKRENCMHEVAEMVTTVYDIAKADVFVNFFPLVCKEYVREGTELGREIFSHSIRSVVNVGMLSSFVSTTEDLFNGCEVTIHVD